MINASKRGTAGQEEVFLVDGPVSKKDDGSTKDILFGKVISARAVIGSFALGGGVRLPVTGLFTSEIYFIVKLKGVEGAAPICRCTHLLGTRGMSQLTQALVFSPSHASSYAHSL